MLHCFCLNYCLAIIYNRVWLLSSAAFKLVKMVTGKPVSNQLPVVKMYHQLSNLEFIAHRVDMTYTTQQAHGALAGGTGSTWIVLDT